MKHIIPNTGPVVLILDTPADKAEFLDGGPKIDRFRFLLGQQMQVEAGLKRETFSRPKHEKEAA